MDSKLINYLNRDIKNVIKEVKPVQGVSKSGTSYTALDVVLINGYTKRLFLRSEEEFCWINAIDLLDTNKVIENNFN